MSREKNMETTSFPLSVTADWLEDGNETSGNQFQQPDWQVGENSDWFEKVQLDATSHLTRIKKHKRNPEYYDKNNSSQIFFSNSFNSSQLIYIPKVLK